jgi:putative MATE family efflux protein
MSLRDPDFLDTQSNRPDHADYASAAALPVLVPDESGALGESLPAIPVAADEFSSEITTIPLTRRALHSEVWQLAWPSVMTMLLQTVNSMMDTLFVGHLPNGAAALAATGVGGSIMFLMISLAMGVTVGTTALVARFTGANEHENAIHTTGQSLTLSFVLAAIFGALAYLGRIPLVGLMLDTHRNPEATLLCVKFLNASLLGTIPLFLVNVFHAAFRGIGNTRTPMLVTVAIIGTHITCNALLIYGLFGFPKLGVQGAGTALALSQYVGTALFLFTMIRFSPLGAALRREHLALRLDWAWRVLRIGLPASLQAVIRTLGMMSFTGLLARTLEGAAGVAALQIGIRAEAIAFMPGFGYSIAAATLVGQSLGARDPDRAERYGWAATGQAMLVMSVMAVLYYTLAWPFAAVFTNDPLVVRLGAEFLRVAAFAEPFFALGVVLTGALQGAGDTLRPTVITFFVMWILRLPLASWLMFHQHLNALGAWYAMASTTALGGVLTVGLFRSDKWKRIKV